MIPAGFSRYFTRLCSTRRSTGNGRNDRRPSNTTMKENGEREPEIVRASLIEMQVCVPKHWMENQVIEFALSRNPKAQTKSGWRERRQGSLLEGNGERKPCFDKHDYVHVFLEINVNADA